MSNTSIDGEDTPRDETDDLDTPEDDIDNITEPEHPYTGNPSDMMKKFKEDSVVLIRSELPQISIVFEIERV